MWAWEKPSCRKGFVVAIALSVLIGACARYEKKPLPIQLPSSSPNAVEVFGATLGVMSYSDPQRAKEVFGIDILGAGVLPVQLVFDHQGQDPIEIVTGQTFLVDGKGQLWEILERDIAYKRIHEKTEWGKIAPEAGKGAALGVAAGAIIGAAIGIVSGGNVLETTGKGAAVGAAGGAVIGGAKGHQDPDVSRSIRDDLRNRSLENRAIPPQNLSHGVLYFPGEAIGAPQLRLQLKNQRTGEVRLLTLAL